MLSMRNNKKKNILHLSSNTVPLTWSSANYPYFWDPYQITTVGVRQGYLISPTPFNIFLERIVSDALEEHDGKVSIGGRTITNLRLTDNIDALAEEGMVGWCDGAG